MKKATLPIFLLLISYCCMAQDKQAIIKLMRTQEVAWNKGDIPGFMEGYWKSDSLMFISKRGPNYGWQQTLDGYKRGYPDKAAMGKLTFTIMKVELLGGKDAFVLGQWDIKRQKDGIGGYFTLWFRKFPDGWKIVCDHTS
ncbi:nuclear transport factor 2 family protein [Inquilinus sp. KBS0705]|nr:nuclear transport factor 2 family protein [Inquilinus sp. KBS0705]